MYENTILLYTGGFALVFQVLDQRGKRYALKRLAVNNQGDLKLCKQEIAVMVSIQGSIILCVYK